MIEKFNGRVSLIDHQDHCVNAQVLKNNPALISGGWNYTCNLLGRQLCQNVDNY